MSKPPIRRLGRGLSSLISHELVTGPAGKVAGERHLENPSVSSSDGLAHSQRARLGLVQIDAIRTNPVQPRKVWDGPSLDRLAESIRERGTLQPILVRPADGGYELIAGERRLRAAKMAGLTEIPALIRAVPDDEMLELALLENIQRADLNPLERARAYRVLQDKYGLSADDIGRRLGEDRATVANYIRLLSLDNNVIDLLASGEIDVGHAKALLGISDRQSQISIALRVAKEHWSVRQIEGAVARLRKGATPAAAKEARPAVKDMEEKLAQAVGTRVSIHEGRRQHTGRIVVEYYSLDDFDRIVARLGVPHEPA